MAHTKDLIIAIGTRNWESVESECRKHQKLIESAPDLLSACEKALNHYKWCSKKNPSFKNSGTMDLLKQAISKAKGE